MGNQQTFASMAWNEKGKVTRRERFLAEMDAVIPWPRLVRLIEPHYPKAGHGRQPGSVAWAGAGVVRRSSLLEGRRSQVLPDLGRALPDQPAPHLLAAFVRALADDQPGALAARARGEHAFR